MKKWIKKWLFVLFNVVTLLLLVVMPSIYLTGVWHMQLGPIKINFSKATNIGFLSVWYAISIRDCVDRWLSSSEVCISFSKRKARRWRIRLGIVFILFLITGVAYLVGQKYQLHTPFEYLGGLNVGDLLFVWIIYVFATFASVGMSQKEEEKSNKAKDENNHETQ